MSDCIHCRKDRFRFRQAVALGLYRDALQSAVLRAKQPGGAALATALGKLLARQVEADLASARPDADAAENPRRETPDVANSSAQKDTANAVQVPPKPPQDGCAAAPAVAGQDGGWPIDLVAPVPVHSGRWHGQAAHSAESISRPIARRLGVPLLPDLLRWRRRVDRQSTLLPAARRDNVRGALRVGRQYDIKGIRALVVDDVLTTGATAHEAARALLEAGAAAVVAAVVARGIGPE